MQMKLIVMGQGTGAATLRVDISGYTLELSGVAPGRRVAICEAAGRVSVAVEDAQPAGEAQPEAAQAQEPEQVPAMEAAIVPEAVAVVQPEPTGAVVQPISGEQLFQHLVTLRKQIASEAKLPPYVIFHDITLAVGAINLRNGLSPSRSRACRAHTKRNAFKIKVFLFVS